MGRAIAFLACADIEQTGVILVSIEAFGPGIHLGRRPPMQKVAGQAVQNC
jgi:hypothetical protein